MTKKQLDIIRAACAVFEKHGYSGTGMETIAEAAGVSKRTLYKYYGSKEAVFSAIIKHLRQSATLKQCPRYQPGTSVRGQLVGVVYAMLAHLNREEHIRLARIIIAEVIREPKLSEILSEAADFSKSAPFLWIRSAMEDGQLRSEAPEKALTHLGGLVKSAVMWPRLFFCHAPLTEGEIRNLAEEYADFFLSYYRL
ncbi:MULTISPECIES: TetR/AcrR family transcriptional regulator [unclassified Pseudodesulfovibrio]|uniref:TetR/AcrR family transcriptional regulator n=1 Tax=unclassified Pseudodesulfovibrio TaxID=2661612 RepID=UPI0013E2F6B2|nr:MULTISPECIES: TetR/AcrR family transcriptional regulator [unclassified Pseudodesulfovibrio]MCJ2163537.1 TetR/AcrR family transcriptional regulator [Pseudodesulfovibrio sp. S3-i]